MTTKKSIDLFEEYHFQSALLAIQRAKLDTLEEAHAVFVSKFFEP